MATALILTNDASEAFHAQQILGDLFDRVRACNTVAGALAEVSACPPDLVIVFGLEGFRQQPVQAATEVGISSIPAMLMCSGLQAVGSHEPGRAVRVHPPLTTTSTLKALQDLGLVHIVKQSSLPMHLRRPGK